MINIVDRIGKTHRVGSLVYAYFDTLTEKYIVLDKDPESMTPTIYGNYYEYEYEELDDERVGYILVEYVAGLDFCGDNYRKGDIIYVSNKLKLDACGLNGTPAIAIKMEQLKERLE